MTLTCKRHGCGQNYSPDDNADGCCQYHPGNPIFHEGLKGWSCCKKRFTDFDDFLNHKHTDVEDENEVDANEAIKALSSAPVDRLSLEARRANASIRDGATKTKLELTVSKSLEKALAKQQEAADVETASTEIKIGQSCTNNACKGSYQGPESNEEECLYHPGTPVFHEGYKYWSCCSKKKTWEFEKFLDFKGCTTGKHRWVKPLEEQAKAKNCRHDWFQSDSHVVLTVFAKCIDPERSTVSCNTDSITVSIAYQRCFTYDLELHLAGKIDPSQATVQVLSTKMDIKLPKAADAATSWPALTAEEAKAASADDS